MLNQDYLRMLFRIFLVIFSIQCTNAKNTKYTPIILDSSFMIMIPFTISNPSPIKIGLLKKTGQTKSYNKEGTLITNGSIKDDGYYQKGIAHRYTRHKDIVTDHVTGLQWEDDIESGSVVKSWLEAKEYCSKLSLNGRKWRLPTVHELQTIIVYNANRQITDPIFLNNNTFPYEEYWSSTIYARFESNMYALVISRNISNDYKTEVNSVRCVR